MPEHTQDSGFVQIPPPPELHPGDQPMWAMTLRDTFAASSLDGLLMTRGGIILQQDVQQVAEQAYALADAMLAQRQKT